MSLSNSVAPGQFDDSFGTERNGQLRIGAQGISGFSALLPDGSFTTVGYFENNPEKPLGSVKHNALGLFDTHYGVVNISEPLIGSVYAIAAQPDGKVVVLGAYYQEGSDDRLAYLARLSVNGQPDDTFGKGGMCFLDENISNKFVSVFALTVQPDGKVLATFTGDTSSTIIRLNKNGGPDADFGESGTIYLSGTVLQSLALHREGYVFGGHNNTAGVVLRYLDDGSPDTSFGDQGVFEVNLTSGPGLPCVFGLATEVNGNITLAGSVWHQPSEINFIARILPDGKLDDSFNQGTVLETTTEKGAYKALAIQADGKPVALARDPYYGKEVNVIRHKPSGEWDDTFGTAGVALAYEDPNGRPVVSYVDKIQIQTDGKILVSGFYRNASYIGRLHG